MSTFYGYAEREAGDQIDWSLIGKEITTMLQTEVDRREKLKTEIDGATRSYGKTLSEAPTGQHRGATDAVIEYAANAQSARLVQDRLLKSGQLKVKDYLRQRQNLVDGTNTMFAAAKAVQKETAEKIERMMKEGSGYEMALFKASEGFTNWNKVAAYIDPTSYKVSLGMKVKKETADGKVYYEMGKSPADYLTAAEMYNYATLKMDKIDLEKPLDNIAANIGSVVQTIIKDGKLITVDDATGRILDQLKVDKEMSASDIKVVNKFNQALNDSVEALFSNPIENGSIAYDYYGTASNGKKYKFVWTKEEMEKSPENIYLEKDPAGGPPTPVFHDKGGVKEIDFLKKKAKRGVIQRIKQSYKEKTEFRPEILSAAKLDRIDNKNEAIDSAKSWVDIWVKIASNNYSQEQSDAAIQNVLNKGLWNKEGDKLVEIDKDGSEDKQLMILKFQPTEGNAYFKKVPLKDKEGYVEGLLSFLPSNIKKYYSEDKIKQYGLNIWGEGNAFNTYKKNAQIKAADINYDNISVPSGRFNDKGGNIFVTIADAFTQTPKTDYKKLVAISNNYFNRINSKSKSGSAKIIPATVSDAKGYIEFSSSDARIDLYKRTKTPKDIQRDLSKIIARAANNDISPEVVLDKIKGVINTLKGKYDSDAKMFQDPKRTLLSNEAQKPIFNINNKDYPISVLYDEEERKDLIINLQEQLLKLAGVEVDNLSVVESTSPTNDNSNTQSTTTGNLKKTPLSK